MPLSGDRKPVPFLKTPFAELNGVLSPDGRFLAYQSNESGRQEIYVQAFPGPGGKWQISTSGGREPQWRADGKELYYRAFDQKVMAVDIQTGSDVTASTPQRSFPGSLQHRCRPHPLPPDRRREALLDGRPARARVDGAHDGRPELVRGTGEVT